MQILIAAIAVALLLLSAWLTFACRGEWARLAAPWLRVAPWWAGLLLAGAILSPNGPLRGFQRWLLLRVSPWLPSNILLMTAILLAALAPLYWAVEIAFRQIEFPDKKAQTTE